MTPSHIKFCMEIDHRHKLYTKHFYALTFTKMVTMRNFDISDKFNVSGICVNANYAQKWLTKLYHP